MTFTANQVVWQEHDPINSQFFLIREGTASQKDAGTGAITAKLGPGKYFGQQSLVGSGEAFVLPAAGRPPDTFTEPHTAACSWGLAARIVCSEAHTTHWATPCADAAAAAASTVVVCVQVQRQAAL